MKVADVWQVIKLAGWEWMEDRAPRLGAALAYYATFSLGPLLLISIAVAGAIFGEDAARGQILSEVRGLVGEEGSAALQIMLVNAAQPSSKVAAAAGMIMLLFGAAGLFGQLQDALNTVWEVQPKPGRGLLGMLRDRFLSMSMVLGCAFLLLVSLVVSAAISALSNKWGDWQAGLTGQVINFSVSFAVITLLFAMIFRFLPDAEIAWRDVWLGAVVTAVLFNIGKLLIGMYLGHSALGSTFGAAGSLAVLLIWFYYSAQIFLFGAELTRAYADVRGMGITPSPNAETVTQAARDNQGMPAIPHKTSV